MKKKGKMTMKKTRKMTIDEKISNSFDLFDTYQERKNYFYENAEAFGGALAAYLLGDEIKVDGHVLNDAEREEFISEIEDNFVYAFLGQRCAFFEWKESQLKR